MTDSQVRRQWESFPVVRAWWMKNPFKSLGGTAEPGSPLTTLPLRLAERCRPYQRFARVRPAIRVRLVFVVLGQPPRQTLHEGRRRGEIAAPQYLPGQHAEEQLHLLQPRAVLRREMEH